MELRLQHFRSSHLTSRKMNNSVITHNSSQMWVNLEVRRSQSFTKSPPPPAPHTDTHPWSKGTVIPEAPDVRCYRKREAFCEASDKPSSQSRAGSGVIRGCTRGRNVSFAHRIVFLFTRARSLDSSNQSGPGTAGDTAEVLKKHFPSRLTLPFEENSAATRLRDP